ncbi:ferric-chelate reductase [Eremomyces bilateralis CBS 781.70]|uniref:Ferric-chelate reductase n=1 Tax=Eremomyces bilateralis CBS 781.70 TaxID=1392243 RepID=A0A6G1G4J4_9PEZI|nr:ferric-chelate reductase [Eremomyces bilateralis CBS 781.70]KAF1812948.1 ferric-chelate reductase [Eremomyces bilateralis CBS 781.70]
MNHGSMSGGEAEKPKGLPFFDYPLEWHSSRTATCREVLTAEECAWSRGNWRYWYISDLVYARAPLWFALATIGVFTLIHLLSRSSSPKSRAKGPLSKVIAGFRYLSYKGYNFRAIRWLTPSLGVLLLTATAIVYLFILTLGPKPYYWPNHGTKSFGNSPPIATRTGWMALAILPFNLALASKSNWITLATGVPHEKLQVFHQYSAWAMLVLALIHTFPFIIYRRSQGDLGAQWTANLYYWTGVAALIPQAYLTFFSWAPLRKRFYEFFKATHILAAVVFIVFFFIHCSFTLTSVDYFIAAGAVYLSGLWYSQLKSLFLYGFSHKAVLTPLPSGMIKAVVPLRSGGAATRAALRLSWHPGQHFFVRFISFRHLGLQSLTSHPFTICSLPPSKDGTSPCEAVFYIESARGVTGRLAAIAQKSPGISIPVMLEGPFGGIALKSFAQFDRAVIIAGGSGAGFTLPLVEDILARQKGRDAKKTLIQVVLAARKPEVREWFVEEIGRLHERYPGAEALSVAIHLTGDSRNGSSGTPSLDEKNIDVKVSSTKSRGEWLQVSQGRPHLSGLLEEWTANAGESVAIAVCGPDSMTHDVREAASLAQTRVLAGRGASEVYLHTEGFSW